MNTETQEAEEKRETLPDYLISLETRISALEKKLQDLENPKSAYFHRFVDGVTYRMSQLALMRSSGFRGGW